MANKIIPKKSSVAAKAPLATDLVTGEIAVNLTDKLIFSKDAAGNVIVIARETPADGSITPTKLSTGGPTWDTAGNVTVKAVVETVAALTGTTPTINVTGGSTKTWTLTAASTPTVSLTSGQTVTLMVTGAGFAIAWSGVTWKTNSGSAPTLNATGVTAIVLWAVGATVFGARVGNA